VKGIRIWHDTVAGDGTESGKGDHFSKGYATRLRVLRCDGRGADREIDHGRLA
jgi:hypothetical protein